MRETKSRINMFAFSITYSFSNHMPEISVANVVLCLTADVHTHTHTYTWLEPRCGEWRFPSVFLFFFFRFFLLVAICELKTTELCRKMRKNFYTKRKRIKIRFKTLYHTYQYVRTWNMNNEHEMLCGLCNEESLKCAYVHHMRTFVFACLFVRLFIIQWNNDYYYYYHYSHRGWLADWLAGSSVVARCCRCRCWFYCNRNAIQNHVQIDRAKHIYAMHKYVYACVRLCTLVCTRLTVRTFVSREPIIRLPQKGYLSP